ncbi:MAG: nucleotidyltransferase family protein [Limnoraphis sp. WC205]|jgi:hypothetical protein|nr:nucleotidyltransferase family protein [Limnoraphis sp. WC205]
MKNLIEPLAFTEIARTYPEIELLLCCARTNIDPETAERIKTLLQENIDWAYLIQIAACHGVMPLLYQSLNTTYPNLVPNAILKQLQNDFHANAARNLLLTTELLKLLNLFKEHNIPAIPFKGPVLAASVYGNLARRTFSDLDILISRRDLQKTKDLLFSQGFRLEGYQCGWALNCRNENNLISLDLHIEDITPWQFASPLNLDYFWPRLELVSLMGKTVPNLKPEDLILILCINVARDFWQQRERLAQICDIAELTHSCQQIDWNQVIKQAQKIGCKRILFIGIILMIKIFKTEVTEEVMQKIEAESTAQNLAKQVHQHLLYGSNSKIKFRQKLLFSLRARERWQDKVKYFVYPDQKDITWLESRPLFYSLFYYLIRPIRLLYQYAIKPLKSRKNE